MMDDYFHTVETQIGDRIAAGAHRRRWVLTRARGPKIPFGTLAMAGSTAVVLVIAALVLLNVHRSAPAQPGGAHLSAAAIDPSLVGAFRLLRRPLTPADRLPAATAADIRRGLFAGISDHFTNQPAPPSVAQIELLPALTRRTTIRGTGYSIWLIPGRHGMCWFSQAPDLPLPSPAVCVGTLTQPSRAIIDGSWIDVEPTNNAFVGLVTDRVRAVLLVDSTGARHPVPLSDGFYVTSIPGSSERLVAVTPSGAQALYPQPSPARAP
jgi:hypothetical protein